MSFLSENKLRALSVVFSIVGVSILGYTIWTVFKPTNEQRWVYKQESRCNSMGGTGNYDNETNMFECYRHPIGRFTKKLFEEKHQGE